MEHKSYPDRKVTFQILNYLQKMLEKSWSQKKFIQPVLAFLVYHSEGSSKLIDFDAEYSHLPEEIKRDLFGVRIREVNITELDPEAI
ncbi:MAG: Rpn family recombination-promoting nuclease/putative transposase, partial [Halarsenatibacteraceae bacterium]